MTWMYTAHVRVLARGYNTNFLEPVLRMIQGQGHSSEPAVLCDLVPRKHASTIRGFVIVMPPVNDHLSLDAMEEAAKEYGIERLVIRDGRDMRTVSHAYDFLVDFPRNINALPYSRHVESFKSYVSKNSHSTFVTVVVWERFTEVMKYLKEAEDSGDEEIEGLSWAQLEQRVPRDGDIA